MKKEANIVLWPCGHFATIIVTVYTQTECAQNFHVQFVILYKSYKTRTR